MRFLFFLINVDLINYREMGNPLKKFSLFSNFHELERNLLGKMYLFHSNIKYKTLNYFIPKEFKLFLSIKSNESI